MGKQNIYPSVIKVYPIGCIWIANIVSSFQFSNIHEFSFGEDTLKKLLSLSSMVIYPPKINFDMFSKGTVIAKGSRCPFATVVAISFFKRKIELISTTNCLLYVNNLKSANFVCTVEIPFTVDQKRLDEYGNTYKGDEFPTSGIFEPSTKMSCTISTNKILICGAKGEKHCVEAYKYYISILEPYRLQGNVVQNKKKKKKTKVDNQLIEDILISI